MVNCIASHHGEVEPQSVEAVIVAAADAISGARPGARRESFDTYIDRVTELESIGNSFEGVSQTFAIQAGHESVCLYAPKPLTTLPRFGLATTCQRSKTTCDTRARIRVTVVRESRAVDYRNNPGSPLHELRKQVQWAASCRC